MSPALAYFGPVLLLGLLLGAVPGVIWLRRKRRVPLIVAAVAAVAGAALWHGPLGAADRLTSVVEQSAKQRLADWEMSQVTAHLHREPLSRRLLLSGSADDFQRSELVRIMSDVPGVGRAAWDQSSGIPLMVESAALALLGFLGGLLLAYLVELRRRYNAQWRW